MIPGGGKRLFAEQEEMRQGMVEPPAVVRPAAFGGSRLSPCSKHAIFRVWPHLLRVRQWGAGTRAAASQGTQNSLLRAGEALPSLSTPRYL